MVIEVNKNIDNYKESVVLGLTARQLIFSIISLIVGGGIVLLTYPYGADNQCLHCNSGGCTDCIDRILFLQRHDFCGNDEVKAALCFWQPDADLYVHGRANVRYFVESGGKGKAKESRQHG